MTDGARSASRWPRRHPHPSRLAVDRTAHHPPKAELPSAQVRRAQALSQGPPPTGNRAVPVFAHGSLEVELYTPHGCDPQQPHRRDEAP